MHQSDYDRMLAHIMRDEGAKRNAEGQHVAYRCTAGALTIGYGHNLGANPVPGINEHSTLNDDQARRLLVHDVSAVQRSLEARLPWVSDLDPARYAVLVNMAYNLGVNGLLGFRAAVAHAHSGDWRHAAREMLNSAWAKQVKGRAQRLAKQIETGVWQ